MLQGFHPIGEDAKHAALASFVNKIGLGQHAHCAGAIRIDLGGPFQDVDGGDVDVDWNHGEHHRAILLEIPGEQRVHVLDDRLALPLCRRPHDARQIDDGEIWHVWSLNLDLDVPVMANALAVLATTTTAAERVGELFDAVCDARLAVHREDSPGIRVIARLDRGRPFLAPRHRQLGGAPCD